VAQIKEFARQFLSCVKAARERVRDFAAEQAREVGELAGIDHDIASARADQIKAALKAGAIPIFEAVPIVSANSAKMADAQNRLSATKLALEELQADEHEAEAAVSAAMNEERAAITALMADEANAIAARVEALEGEALVLRARLGGPLGVVGQLRAGLSAAVGQVMNSNHLLEAVMLHDRALTEEADRAAVVWRAFAAALEGDADAELSFDRPTDAWRAA